MKCTLLVISLLWSTGLLLSQDALQIISIDEQIKDLGLVKKGEKIAGQYVFTNISDQDIEIDLVSTCECTEAKWTSGVVKPGGKGKIDFVFDSSQKEKEEPVDVDVYFVNTNPDTGNPFSIFLQYNFKFK